MSARASFTTSSNAGCAACVHQCELLTHTVVEAHKAFRRGGWDAVSIHRIGSPTGTGRMLTPEQSHCLGAGSIRTAGLFGSAALLLAQRQEIRICVAPSRLDEAFGAGRPRRVAQLTKHPAQLQGS